MRGATHPRVGRRALVIGVGNALRRDDGIGHAVVQALQQTAFPDNRFLLVHQLTPELVEDLSLADVVVFVDAAVDLKELHVAAVQPADPPQQLLAHATDPAGLLAFARQQYGHAPEAWTIGIPAHDLGYGEGFSAGTRSYLDLAIEAATRIIGQPCTSSP